MSAFEKQMREISDILKAEVEKIISEDKEALTYGNR